MNTKKPIQLNSEEIRQKLAGAGKKSPPSVVQKVTAYEPPKKIGRKSHALEGVEYVRMGVKIPVELKTEMVVAMATTHREYKTMDLFIAEAMRVFLSLKR